jgi:hypothetical protein
VLLHTLDDSSLLVPDFGIEPTSVAGGLVKVEDEVTLTFRIGARVIP